MRVNTNVDGFNLQLPGGVSIIDNKAQLLLESNILILRILNYSFLTTGQKLLLGNVHLVPTSTSFLGTVFILNCVISKIMNELNVLRWNSASVDVSTTAFTNVHLKLDNSSKLESITARYDSTFGYIVFTSFILSSSP